MFKIAKNRTFKRTVTVNLPTSEVDRVVEQKFVAEFRAMTRSDIEALQAQKLTDREFVGKILVGVDGIGDEAGNPYPAEEARQLVIEDIDVCAATIAAFNEQYVKAKSGN